MTRYDRMSALFFMGLALYICIESIRIGVGSLVNPGPGLTPLGCGLGIGILGLVVFTLTFRSSSRRREVRLEIGTKWLNVVLALVSMVAYSLMIDYLGFPLVTFLWMGFVCRWIARMGWKATIFTSAVATFFTWLLFEYFLEIRFPRGILGF